MNYKVLICFVISLLFAEQSIEQLKVSKPEQLMETTKEIYKNFCMNCIELYKQSDPEGKKAINDMLANIPDSVGKTGRFKINEFFGLTGRVFVFSHKADAIFSDYDPIQYA